MPVGTLHGKTILVTGATDGIGRQTALELAGLGARVLVHGRSSERVQPVVRAIQAESGSASVEAAVADFASLAEVRALAKYVLAQVDHLDVLVNNAGVFMKTRALSHDGFEMTFAVNHLAHFLLTHLLLDRIKASMPARMIHVSSMTHQRSQIDWDDLQGQTHFDGYAAYAQSKLCNVMFSHELALRLEGTGATSNSIHPGVIATKLLRSGFSMGGDDPSAGAAGIVYLASAPDAAKISGKYFVRNQIASHSPIANDPQARARLWQISEIMCGLPLFCPAIF
jgi:NAD(P)-dependent dehydrogenase (short-subunit alcohol dehydrogenase family)